MCKRIRVCRIGAISRQSDTHRPSPRRPPGLRYFDPYRSFYLVSIQPYNATFHRLHTTPLGQPPRGRLAALKATVLGDRNRKSVYGEIARPPSPTCARGNGWCRVVRYSQVSTQRSRDTRGPRSLLHQPPGPCRASESRPAPPCRRSSGARRAAPPTGPRRAWGVAVQPKRSSRGAQVRPDPIFTGVHINSHLPLMKLSTAEWLPGV